MSDDLEKRRKVKLFEDALREEMDTDLTADQRCALQAIIIKDLVERVEKLEARRHFGPP